MTEAPQAAFVREDCIMRHARSTVAPLCQGQVRQLSFFDRAKGQRGSRC